MADIETTLDWTGVDTTLSWDDVVTTLNWQVTDAITNLVLVEDGSERLLEDGTNLELG